MRAATAQMLLTQMLLVLATAAQDCPVDQPRAWSTGSRECLAPARERDAARIVGDRRRGRAAVDASRTRRDRRRGRAARRDAQNTGRRGRCGVEFESRSPAFDRLVDGASHEFLVQGEADALGAHEGAVFLERGAAGDEAPCLIFTTKPQIRDDARWVARIKRLVVGGPEKGRIDTLFESENLVNGATLGHDGRLYFCFQGGQDGEEEYLPSGIYSVDPHNASDVRIVTDAWNDGSDGFDPLYYSSPNDVVVKRDGTVWFTDPSYAHAHGLTPRPSLGEWVWRFDGKNASTVVADGFSRPNGLVFSPDERTLYVTDTGYARGGGPSVDKAAPRSVYAFDVRKGRYLANRRLIYVADRGIPDGIKVDARGRIYTGCEDGVHVLSRDGVLLGKIKLPGTDPAANLAFGRGPWRSTLYILDESSVTAVTLRTRGAPVGRERKPTKPARGDDK